MKVAHIPVYRSNPYNQLLADALAIHGVDAEMLGLEKKRTNPRRYLRQLRKHKIVHWHWLDTMYAGRTPLRFLVRSALFLSVLFELHLRGAKQVFTVHNLFPHEGNHLVLHSFIFRIIGMFASRLFVHHKESIGPVAHVYGARDRIVVIPHPIYPISRVALSRDQLLDKYSLGAYNKWVIQFGVVRAYKNIELLLRAAPSLRELGFGVLVVGECPDPAFALKLSAYRSDNVSLRFGRHSSSQLDELIIVCNAVVLPYAATLTSGAAHLAVAHGRPIIASDHEAFSEFVRRGLARLTDVQDPHRLAKDIEEAVAFPSPDYKTQRHDFLTERCQEKLGHLLSSQYTSVLSP